MASGIRRRLWYYTVKPLVFKHQIWFFLLRSVKIAIQVFGEETESKIPLGFHDPEDLKAKIKSFSKRPKSFKKSGSSINLAMKAARKELRNGDLDKTWIWNTQKNADLKLFSKFFNFSIMPKKKIKILERLIVLFWLFLTAGVAKIIHLFIIHSWQQKVY